MARETVYRCDFHGEFVADADITRLIARGGAETIQAYGDPVDICPPCASRVTVSDALAKMAEHRQRAAEQPAVLTVESLEVRGDEQQPD